MSLLDELALLKTKASDLQSKRGRLEAQLEAATAAKDKALAELNEKFGVGTLAAAEKLLKTRREKLSKAIASLIESLP